MGLSGREQLARSRCVLGRRGRQRAGWALEETASWRRRTARGEAVPSSIGNWPRACRAVERGCRQRGLSSVEGVGATLLPEGSVGGRRQRRNGQPGPFLPLGRIMPPQKARPRQKAHITGRNYGSLRLRPAPTFVRHRGRALAAYLA